jgi:mannose/cellobiose epimerase-like protein (N-acyl-D-glucosamine 2-epimerase family)
MHLFEALLALACEAGCDEAASMARATAEWVVGRLVRRADGALPELYTPEWTELSEAEGGRLDVGHQFEWAYLLSRAVERGLWKAPEAERMLATGERLLGVGMAAGYDEGGGGVWSPAAPDGRVMSRAKGWWEQCEAARAMHHYARLRGRSDLAEPFQRTMAFCRAHLVDPQHGGWYMRVEPDGSVRNRDKGNEWKLDYHVVGLCAEALEVSPGT